MVKKYFFSFQNIIDFTKKNDLKLGFCLDFKDKILKFTINNKLYFF